MTTGTQWHVDADDPRYVVDENDVLVADCYADTAQDFGVPDLEDIAKNAKLIAAAPELLERLDWILEFIGQHPEWEAEQFPADCAERDWLDDARETLAKAKGEQT